MAKRLDIVFDKDDVVRERVTVAVIPIDGFTGRAVGRGVRASIVGHANHPRRNLSGMLVFVDLAEQAGPYEIRVDASEAGYFNETVRFPEAGNSEHAKKRVVVPLLRQPGAPLESETTYASGEVRLRGVPVADARVTARPAVSIDAPFDAERPTFHARTNERGAFVIPMRLPEPAEGEAGTEVLFHFQAGYYERELEKTLVDGAFHSFQQPIDVAETGGGPDLLAPGSGI